MIVLDASALIDVVIDQPAKERVLAHLDQPIVAPAHQLAEVLSALARLVRADAITAAAARAALDEATALEQEHVTPSSVHLRRALELQQQIRVLDGLYAALAEERRCPLLTTDQRLVASDPPCDAILAKPDSA
ncbi:MAG: PIN domain-containing protein [Streptosporangiales bacterium]|nr:PIN domain-containing protein [Streptosporangiales bacterium]